MFRCPSPLNLLLVGTAATVQVAWTVVVNAFGFLPLVRRRLSRQRPTTGGPELSPVTALLFRLLVLYRWWMRDNFVGRRLASLYLHRASREVGRAPARPALPEALPSYEAGEISQERFFKNHVVTPHPAVIRRLHQLSRDWSLDALVEEFGDTELLFNEDFQHRIRPLRRLRDAPSADLYVANSEQLLVRHPALLADLGLDRYAGWTRGQVYCAQLFLGARRGRGLIFHCANNLNVFTMLHGRKRWTFVHPEFSYFMYPLITRESAYVASIVNHVETPPSMVPLFEHCPRLEVVLEPGDVLVNPPWWWHHVENLDDETVGCASRWARLGIPDTNALFSFAQCTSLTQWRATVGVGSSLLACGGDLASHYRRSAAGSPTTVIEEVSHTAETTTRGARFREIFPTPEEGPAPPAPRVSAS